MCSEGCRSIVARPYRGRVTHRPTPSGRVCAVAQVEPLTTARALRGPFDYLRPEGVEVGALLEVPFGRQTLVGVVTGLADSSEHELSSPRRVLEHSLPADLVGLAMWMAAEYCSTPARALSLVSPPSGAGAATALRREGEDRPLRGGRRVDG